MVNRKEVVKKKEIFHSIMYIQWCGLHLKVVLENYSTSNEVIMGIFLTDV